MASREFDQLDEKIWDQTWAHSRHLETMRSQYLGFYFTAVLAVTAIAAQDLADDGLRTTGSLIAFSALMLGLEVLAAFLLLAVKRIGQVLSSYRTSVLALRDLSPRHEERWARLPEASSSYLGSTQGAAEAVLYASLCVFLVALLAGAIRSHVATDLTSVVCWLGFGLGLIVAAACMWKAGLPRRY